MLRMPEIGFSRSKGASNVDTNVSADWVESILLFDEPQLSKNDVVDLLLEEQICDSDSQDMAHQIADEAWSELKRRQCWGGLPNTVNLTANRIVSTEKWTDDIIRAFFVLLSIQRIFPDWASSWTAYVDQGNLFEKVVERICPALLPGWKIYRAGWSPDNTKSVLKIIGDLREHIHTSGAPDIHNWIGASEKDGGLDLVCYRAFQDDREAVPVFFLQCASGKNWRDKIHAPNAARWAKWLNSAVQPSTGIVAPFVIDDSQLRRSALDGQIIVFDRIRAVSVLNEEHETILGRDLQKEVLDWMSPRVNSLPKVA